MSTDDEQERLLMALRAPGSDAELSDEERYRAMFRAAHRAPGAPVPPRRSRASRRLLAGGAATTLLAVGTGGVAAAYSGRLPDPIQTFAHHVIGAPEAAPSTRARESASPGRTAPSPTAGATRTPSPSAASSGSPSPRPAQETTRRPRRPVPAPAASETSTPSASTSRPAAPPSTTPPAAPRPVLTGVALVGDTAQADVGARVRFSGQLTYSTSQTPRRRVVLQQLVGARWTPVARGRTAADGRIGLTAPALQRSSRFRLLALGARGVHSEPWRVAMHPLMTADVTSTQEQATITLAVSGGSGGDRVALVTRRDGRLVVVGRARLDASGSAAFVITPDRRRTAYGVVLAPTKRHTSARVAVVVTLAQKTRDG